MSYFDDFVDRISDEPRVKQGPNPRTLRRVARQQATLNAQVCTCGHGQGRHKHVQQARANKLRIAGGPYAGTCRERCGCKSFKLKKEKTDG